MSVPIVVYGDVGIDHTLFCTSVRMSPEDATVPVLKHGTERVALGLAANVAANVAQFNPVTLVFYRGPWVNDMQHALFARHIQSVSHELKGVRTTVKQRIYSNGKQLARVDYEDDIANQVYHVKWELDELAKVLEPAKFLIVSDYAKGSCANVKDVIALAKRLSKKVIIDPKGVDWEKYSGAYCVKANRAEIEAVAGKVTSPEDMIQKVDTARKHYNLESLIVTDGKYGAYLSMASSKVSFHFPASRINFVDECGAGDTFVAILAVELNNGLSMEDAIVKANFAAGKVCECQGTTVATAELLKP